MRLVKSKKDKSFLFFLTVSEKYGTKIDSGKLLHRYSKCQIMPHLTLTCIGMLVLPTKIEQVLFCFVFKLFNCLPGSVLELFNRLSLHFSFLDNNDNSRMNNPHPPTLGVLSINLSKVCRRLQNSFRDLPDYERCQG